MWDIYDTLISALPEGGAVENIISNESWTYAGTDCGNAGIAMTAADESRPALFSDGLCGLAAKRAAEAVKSWNLHEASGGMAVINACFNTPERLKALGCAEPYENYCTRGIELAGKTVGVIGHLKMPDGILNGAKAVYILEREPQSGDYPDSACDFILPECDIVLITGCTLVNKTLPHLLSLCQNAYTILTGPTVPMCPELLAHGIDRLAGMVVSDAELLRSRIQNGETGSPYPCGQCFMLEA